MEALSGLYIQKILDNVLEAWPIGLSRNGEYRILINKLKGYSCGMHHVISLYVLLILFIISFNDFSFNFEFS